MQIIKCLSELISEELGDARQYIEQAQEWQTSQPTAADLFYRLSLEEMEHASKLHAEVARLIAEYRASEGEPPTEMLAVYNYLHQKQIDKAAKIKTMQSMYKDR